MEIKMPGFYRTDVNKAVRSLVRRLDKIMACTSGHSQYREVADKVIDLENVLRNAGYDPQELRKMK
jgi:hypothetical protein